MNKFFIKIKTYFINYFFNKFYPYIGLKQNDLIIYDNIYPHPISGFRHEEFSCLLLEFKRAKIVINPTAYSFLNTPKLEHKYHIKDLIKKNNSFKKKIFIGKGFINVNSKLFYCVFLNNIINNIDWLEKFNIPFIFTLYPGGGFQVNNDVIDLKLKRIFESPMFRKVIVNQNFTKNYLLNQGLCENNHIELIFGVVTPQDSISNKNEKKERYLNKKRTLDICFCAAKYSPQGEDKGYDIFIELAKQLSKKYDFIRFHVIGGFSENDIDISSINEIITFYGYQKFENLKKIFKNIDIIISPNRSFVLGKGAFDGFPLGTVVEAVLNGVVALVSDELEENIIFEHNKELIIIKPNVEAITKEIIGLIENPDKLNLISCKGRERFSQIYSNNNQMKLRIDLIRKEIKNG